MISGDYSVTSCTAYWPTANICTTFVNFYFVCIQSTRMMRIRVKRPTKYEQKEDEKKLKQRSNSSVNYSSLWFTASALRRNNNNKNKWNAVHCFKLILNIFENEHEYAMQYICVDNVKYLFCFELFSCRFFSFCDLLFVFFFVLLNE